MDETDQFGQMDMGGNEAQMLAMMQALSSVTKDLVHRVGAGEFGSAQDVMAAFGQAMTQVQSP